MPVNLLFFGQIADVIGIHESTITNVSTSEELLLKLKQKYPAIESMKFSIAINKKMVHVDTELLDNDTIALLPPFSGG